MPFRCLFTNPVALQAVDISAYAEQLHLEGMQPCVPEEEFSLRQATLRGRLAELKDTEELLLEVV